MQAVKVSLSSTVPILLKAACEIGLALKCCVTKLYVPGFINVLKLKTKITCQTLSVSFGDNYSIARLIREFLQCSPLILLLKHSRNQRLF